MFLKIVDNECKKSKIYATDDIYYEFTTTGIQPTRNEKRCHPSKETNALKEVPPFNGEMPPKPSLLKVRKETNVKVNAILPGQLKSLPIFYEETSSATGNTASVTIGDQETDSTGEADISEILGKLSQATDEQFARDILAHADEELPNLSTTSVENEFSTEKATPPPRGKTTLTQERNKLQHLKRTALPNLWNIHTVLCLLLLMMSTSLLQIKKTVSWKKMTTWPGVCTVKSFTRKTIPDGCGLVVMGHVHPGCTKPASPST